MFVRGGPPRVVAYVAWKRCLHGKRRTRWPAQKFSMQMQHDCLVRALASSSEGPAAVGVGALPADGPFASFELRLVITRSRKLGAAPPRAGLGIRHAGETALSAEDVSVLGATEESRPEHGARE